MYLSIVTLNPPKWDRGLPETPYFYLLFSSFPVFCFCSPYKPGDRASWTFLSFTFLIWGPVSNAFGHRKPPGSLSCWKASFCDLPTSASGEALGAIFLRLARHNRVEALRAVLS